MSARLRVGLVVVWAALLCASPAVARDPDPSLSIPIEPIGFRTLSQDFLLGGSSMLTVDFVDNRHLLITFNVHPLMERMVDDPTDDDDRVIGAFLVELPLGHVVARTEWRVHDRGQYLWGIGHGRFLLRVRNRLTVIAPILAATQASNFGDAFREYPFLNIDRHILGMTVSVEDDLLTIETTQNGQVADSIANSGHAADSDPAPVQLNFFRLGETDTTEDGLSLAPAGAIRTRTAVALPISTSGFIDVLESGRNRWLFNFDTHDGKVLKLSPFDTTCFPGPTFVGRGEFVAFGCRGGPEKQNLAAFNLKGQEMWRQKFSNTHVFPTFAFAPSAGRFALGRNVLESTGNMGGALARNHVIAEDVGVYQSYDGKLLFHTQCTPVERAGQNFALSPDGLKVAVVHEVLVHHPATKDFEAYADSTTTLDIYDLPPLSDQDLLEAKQAEALAPADTGERIDFSLLRHVASGAPANNASAKNRAGAASGRGASGAAPVGEGDAQLSASGTPPTLNGPAAAQNNGPATSAGVQNGEPGGATYQLEVRVNRVLVPVVVHDKQGHLVEDLKKEDFQLFDRGKQKPISGFVVERREAETTSTAAQSSIVPQRFIVFLFDDLHLSFEDLGHARTAAAKAIDEVLTGTDMAAVISTSGRINSGMTQNRERLQDAIKMLQPDGHDHSNNSDCPHIDYYQADKILNQYDISATTDAIQQQMTCAGGRPFSVGPGFNTVKLTLSNLVDGTDIPPGATATACSGMAASVASECIAATIEADKDLVHAVATRALEVGKQDVLSVYGVMAQLVRHMAAMPGRRMLILASPGLLPIEQAGQSAESDVMEAAADSNVTISALDARGLYTTSMGASTRSFGSAMPAIPGASPVSVSQAQYKSEAMQRAGIAMQDLANATGGSFFQNSNDMDAGFKALMDVPECIYVLELSLNNVKPDGIYHRLKVTVGRQGLTLDARNGYFMALPPRSAPAQKNKPHKK